MSDLIDPVYRTWREDVINQVFYDFEVAIIKNIPLCRSIQKDVLIQPFNPNGEYSVKSGYRFLQEANALQQPGPSNIEAMKPLWKKYGAWKCLTRLRTWFSELAQIPYLQK